MGSPYIRSNYTAPHLQTFSQETVPEILFAMGFGILKQSCQLAAGYPAVNAGDALGRITATGKYRRITRFKSSANSAIGATSTTVNTRPPVKIGEHVTIGTDAGDHVVTSVDNGTVPGTYTITYTVAIAGAAQASGSSIVLVTPDGSEKVIGFASRPMGRNDYRASDDPNLNYLLDVDYSMDIILGGALVKSKLAGGAFDATMLTDISGKDLSPAFDAIVF